MIPNSRSLDTQKQLRKRANELFGDPAIVHELMDSLLENNDSTSRRDEGGYYDEEAGVTPYADSEVQNPQDEATKLNESPSQDAFAAALYQLQGDWIVVGMEDEGFTATAEQMRGMGWTIGGTTITATDPDGELNLRGAETSKICVVANDQEEFI